MSRTCGANLPVPLYQRRTRNKRTMSGDTKLLQLHDSRWENSKASARFRRGNVFRQIPSSPEAQCSAVDGDRRISLHNLYNTYVFLTGGTFTLVGWNMRLFFKSRSRSFASAAALLAGLFAFTGQAQQGSAPQDSTAPKRARVVGAVKEIACTGGSTIAR